MSGRDEALGLMGAYLPTSEDVSGFAGKVGSATPYGVLREKAPGFTGALEDSAKRIVGGGTVGIGGQAYGAATMPPDTALANLSTKTQAQLRAGETPTTQLQPMATPDVNVPGVAPLDPRMSAFKNNLMGGGGIGGGLSGLAANSAAARKKMLSTLDQERELTGQLGMDKAGRVQAVGDLQMLDAAKRQRDAEIDQTANDRAHETAQAMLDRNQELADDIGRQKIDTSRVFKNMDTKQRVGHVIGGILGGFAAGLKGGSNEFLDRFDKQVDRDIAAQEKEIDNKKSSLSARMNMFGQLLQETGDRRLARMQTRNMMYEAAKQELGAKADQLGIPEIRTNAEQAGNAVQQRQDALNLQFTTEAEAKARAAAAAQAAAAKAAEHEAWQRNMDIAKLGLEKDKLDVEKMKASGMSPEDIQKQVQALSGKMDDKELAEGRMAIDNAKRRLSGAAPDQGLPGVGRMADFRARISDPNSYLGSGLSGSLLKSAGVGLSDEERVSRGDWDKIKLAYQKQITGSGASEAERKMISDAFEGAKSPAEQRNAIAQADNFFSQRESRIKAGFSPQAVSIFENRLNTYKPELPASVKVKQ